MRRIVQALRPSWVLVENVPGFDGAGLEQVVSDLEGDGYQVAPTLEVPACAFGFDHRRSRLWILGYSDHEGESRVPVDAEVAVLPFGGGDQPDELGEAFRVPDWVDRMRLLGNSVVPDEAEWIGKLIRET
jgi:DNA (cytosine-5)-methyltransferase 1